MTTPVPVIPLDAYINPFLLCGVCAKAVQWHTGDLVTNYPCGHKGTYSACLTWAPATGCLCKERFGQLNHVGPSSGGRPVVATAAATTTPATGAKT